MGWAGKLTLAFIGLASFSFGLWPVGLLCFAYLFFSLRPRNRQGGSQEGLPASPSRFRSRVLAAAVLFVLAFAAFSSGGTFSPVVLLALSILALAYPWFPIFRFAEEVSPVENSILLRSKVLPFRWRALAELKPGSDDPSRALSSFSGRLLVSGVGCSALYLVFDTTAFNRRSAERVVISMMRECARALSPGSAYLLPVDSEHLPGFLFLKSRRRGGFQSPSRNLDDGAADTLSVESRAGFVKAMAAYASVEPRRETAALPSAGRTLSYSPHLWELLESIGRRRHWGGPDACTGLLSSLQATRGEPVSERLAELSGSGANLSVRGLGGEEFELSRPQFRAVIEIYS